MTVVRDKDGDYCIFCTLGPDGDLRISGWMSSVEEAMEYIGWTSGYSEDLIDLRAKQSSWQIIKTIDFSKLGGEGYKVGDRVRVISTGKIGRIEKYENDENETHVNVAFGGNDVTHCICVPRSQVEPYFEDEEEEDDFLEKAVQSLTDKGWTVIRQTGPYGQKTVVIKKS